MVLTEQQLQKYRDAGQLLAGITYDGLVAFRVWLLCKGYINYSDIVDLEMMDNILTKLDGEQIDK